MKDIQALLVSAVEKFGACEDALPPIFSKGIDRIHDMIHAGNYSKVIAAMSQEEIEALLPDLYEYHDFLSENEGFYGEDPFSKGDSLEDKLCHYAERFRPKAVIHRMF